MQAPDQQILDRLTVLLRDATDAEDRVYRSREEAVSRVPAIVLVPSNEDVSPISDDLDRADLIVVVSVLVAGDPFDVLAAPICAAVHRLIMTDAQLALLAQARLLGRSWEADGADMTLGKVTIRYRFVCVRRADDIELEA